MQDEYRKRVCPICSGAVACDLETTETEDYGEFNVRFVAQCSGCGVKVTGDNSSIFKLFLDSRPSKLVKEAYADVDDKWVYVTSTYRGL